MHTPYDVAHVRWGQSWQLPTHLQIQELISECKHQWVTEEGVPGMQFTGPNGNILFLPAAGIYKGSELDHKGGMGLYHIGSRPEHESLRYLFIDSTGDCYPQVGVEYYGTSVRAVWEQP